jgi:hypothetical protein
MNDVEETMWLEFICHFRKLSIDKIDNYDGEPYGLNVLNDQVASAKHQFLDEL